MKKLSLFQGEKDSYDLDDTRSVIVKPKGWFSRLIWRFISIRLQMVDMMIPRLWADLSLDMAYHPLSPLNLLKEPNETSPEGEI